MPKKPKRPGRYDDYDFFETLEESDSRKKPSPRKRRGEHELPPEGADGEDKHRRGDRQ
jgi:hypothetical protein